MWNWLVVSLLLNLLLAVTTLGMSASTHEFLLWTRYTARLAFLFFCAAYAAGPLVRVYRNSMTLLLVRERRNLGLNFAFCHGIHIIAILAYVWVSDESISVFTWISGGTVYLIILAMTISSFDPVRSKMNPVYWRRLHGIGINFLALIFLNSYVYRMLERDIVGYLGSGFLLFIMVLRLVWSITKKSKREYN